MSRRLWHRLCWLGLLVFLAFREDVTSAGPHYVFAHYMVCYATYGETIDAYEREIQQAQGAGLDGFALNVGGWNATETYYKTRVALIYNAAEQLGTGFKLFFSVDDDGNPSNDWVGMVLAYAQRTNTFRQNGKVVLSTYDCNGLDWPGMRNQLSTNGVDTFFIPYLLSTPVHELPTYADAVGILSTNRWGNAVDGLFLWVAAGLPAQLALCNGCYLRACREAGVPFMASCSPHYWGCTQNSLGRRYFESQGGEGTVLQWTSIITNQPDWVEICTWNDFNESTYISPVDNPGNYFSNLQTPRRYCHAGYLELAKRFISWFKSGSELPITQDALYYFYRTHPKNAVASNTNDVPVTAFAGDVQDVIYTTVFLTAPAQLEIQSGPTSSTNLLGIGMTQLRTPFAPGSQQMLLRRGSSVVLSAQGPDIMSAIQVYDFFPASGFAYGPGPPPAPPSNLALLGQPAPSGNGTSGAALTIPANLTAVAADQAVNLSWTAPVSGAASYNVKRSATSNAETLLANTTATSFVDTSVTNGVADYYVVSALAADGTESPNSREVSATPVAIATNLPGLSMTLERWLAAYTNVFADSQAATPATPGGQVKRWNDSSGHGNDVVDPGPYASPLTGSALAGQPAIGSFGGFVYFTNLNAEPTYPSPQTFVLILQPAYTNNAYYFDSGVFATGANELCFNQQHGWLDVSAGTSGSHGWPAAGTNAVWYCVTFCGSWSAIVRNGATVDFGIILTPTPINGLTIGCRRDNNAGFFYSGYLAEFAQYGGVPSAADIMTISNYCAARYGIHN